MTYNQDYHPTQNPSSKRQITYTGCGCAGDDVTTVQGEPTATGTPENRRTQKIFRDVLGRTVKTQVMNYDGSAYSTTLTEYNVRDQATAVKEFKGDAAIGASCPLGNCQQTELVYDGHGRLQKRYLPIYQDNNVAPPYNSNSSARSADRQYYNDDRVNIETDPRGATATYTYNNRGLVTGVSYYSPNPSVIPNKPNVTFGYDELGKRSSMADGAGTITYNNNGLGQTMSESRVFTMSGAPSGTFTVNYDYTIGGQLKYVRDPFGDQINYDYDRAGRLISVTGATAFAGVTNYASGIQYRAWGALKANRTYDARLRLTSAYYNGAINYQYNQASDLTYAEMTTGSQYHQSFGYDQVGRLTSVSTPEITVPNQYVMTQSNPPNGLPANYKIRPFTTSVSYDEFDNATSTTNSYWHDITPNLNYSQQFFQTTYVNGRVKKDGVAGKVYNNRDETWAYNTMGQITADTRTTQTFDAAGQTTRTQDAGNAQIYVNYGYDGDGLQAKFDQKRANGTTEVRYRIYSSVLGGLLTDISSTGQKVETRVYRFVYGQDSVRQVKAYSVPNGGNPPFNYPDVVVFEGSDPHGTRASVWDHDTNTNKTLSLAAPGAYVEDINWQGLKDRFVSNIGSQYSYGQQAASQYLSSYFSMVDPRNPGTGCSLGGVKKRCSEVLHEIQTGGTKSAIFSTTGIGGGDMGVLAGAFTLAAGQASSTRKYLGRRRIGGEEQTITTTFEGYEGSDVGVFDTPRFEDVYANSVTGFWGLGGIGGQQGGGQQGGGQERAPACGYVITPAVAKAAKDAAKAAARRSAEKGIGAVLGTIGGVVGLLLMLETETGPNDTPDPPNSLITHRWAKGLNASEFKPRNGELSTYEQISPVHKYNVPFRGYYYGEKVPGTMAKIVGVDEVPGLRAIYSPLPPNGPGHWDLLQPAGMSDEEFKKGLSAYARRTCMPTSP